MHKKKVKPADYLFWALKQDTGSPTSNLLLIYLADHMGNKGCFPSYPALAKRCGCTRISIVRHINKLVTDGWITRTARSTEKGAQTSNKYSLSLAKSGVSQGYGEGITMIQGGYHKDTGGGITEIHETPSIKHPVKHPVKHTPQPPAAFDQFYSQYPKKVGRQAAEKAWKKLNPTPALIDRIMIDIVQRVELGAWCTGKGKQYIPGPAPYLNGHKWTDEIIPRPEFTPEVDFTAIAREFTEI